MPVRVGLCKVELNPFGHVQLQHVASVAPPVKVKLLPAQIGFGLAEALTPVGTVQPMQPKATQVEDGASHASKHRVVVLNINKLLAGEAMASRSAVVIRGRSKPLLVELTSNIDEASGALPVPFIPTPCEKADIKLIEISIINKDSFFIFLIFNF